jgi:hypothetical protein
MSQEGQGEDVPTWLALQAFVQRAVLLGYIPFTEAEAVTARLCHLPPGEREKETVKAVRRFLAFDQPLGEVITFVPECPVRLKAHPGLTLVGLPAEMDSSAPPGGSPERYSVLVQLPGEEEPDTLVQIEPRYLWPGPIEDDTVDPNAEPIPLDRDAEAWFDAKVAHYERCLAFGQAGPSRPTGSDRLHSFVVNDPTAV